MPGRERSASPVPVRARTASSRKNDTEVIRRAAFSRASRTACSRAENCQATAAAEETSMAESRPKPIRAVEEARVPTVRATAVGPCRWALPRGGGPRRARCWTGRAPPLLGPCPRGRHRCAGGGPLHGRHALAQLVQVVQAVHFRSCDVRGDGPGSFSARWSVTGFGVVTVVAELCFEPVVQGVHQRRLFGGVGEEAPSGRSR